MLNRITIYMYKGDLALNNLQQLICYKTKPNQTMPLLLFKKHNGNFKVNLSYKSPIFTAIFFFWEPKNNHVLPCRIFLKAPIMFIILYITCNGKRLNNMIILFYFISDDNNKTKRQILFFLTVKLSFE